MGKMNLLKADWQGKVGQTVGAKWKNKSTIRTYSIPSDPKTAAQLEVRGAFKELTSYVALFSDQIKYLTALDTSGMSVRNAIIKLNKEMVGPSGFDKANLLISKGGLQKIAGFTPAVATNKLSATWTAPTATNFTADAKIIIVGVQQNAGMVEVIEADATAGTATGQLAFAASENIDVFAYYLDKRGSSKVASESIYAEATNP